MPWSTWPCGVLLNLMPAYPAYRAVNQHQKRHRIPSAGVLAERGVCIADWWECAYLIQGDQVLPYRFAAEAAASLPGTRGSTLVSSGLGP